MGRHDFGAAELCLTRPDSVNWRLWCLFLIHCLLFFSRVERSSAKAVTDPVEVKALNAILGRWGKQTSPAWNISGEPCSGWAIDTTGFDNSNFNPAIKCDCSFNSNRTCHITHLKVYALDVRGTIPEELQNLTHLTNLNLAQNYLTGTLPAFIGIFTGMQYLNFETNALSGPIPKVLGNLTQLISLNLAQNYLTGTLPAFIGIFTSMQYLTFGINALSGPIPKELGNLTKLISLSLSTNSFNGSVPPELGNLSSLEQWYMGSCGLSGDLPRTLSKLKNLKILWASDNNFTGKIPDYIGSWTYLTSLKFQGNSFQGPIPSSIGTLTQLNDLRIGDITNGSSSLAFIKSLTSLSVLILRNNLISDTIPSNFSQFSKLGILDLSFNNVTGPLPHFLLNLSSLNFLFLGNNSLSGNLPAQKSTSLLNIDLSYNQLTGKFPSWVSQQNLKLNLVANNFVIDSSNNSILPSGLDCLQRNIPCNLGSPIYSSFAINCGGNKPITATDGSRTVYDIDNANLATASYYVTDEKKWAVSNVGSFVDSSNPNYIITSLSQFQNTLNSELFQNERLSPSSLRYYGLGLQNGNYSVTLRFAETQILDPPTWKSEGKRIFDIYIQGDRKEKDFDLKKEAGGHSFTAVEKKFIAPVTNNFLEIHFFWAGKGTCCVPTQGYYGASISAISVSPSGFTPTVINRPPNSGSKSRNTGLIVGIVSGIAILGLVGICVLYIQRQKRKGLSADDEELSNMTIQPNTFSYSELKTGTENFSSANKLGEGGFGPVFKGTLFDGRLVAVKQLSLTSHQGRQQFMTEIATVSAVQHRNLVKLYGCCIEGDMRLLVYEYLENRSLDQALFGKSSLHIDWPTRFEICLGTARGLAYLHEESRVRIVHRDIKASNILLDAELSPKISDFGLAKLFDAKQTHISTRVAGTFGYLAPEYAMRGLLTEKVDVFGFGVVALEILSGRPNSDTSLDEEKIYLLDWAWHLHENKRSLDILDPKLSSFNKEEAARVIGVALLCIQASPTLRPTMSRVVALLTGGIDVSEVTTRPGYLTDWQFEELGTFMSRDYSGGSAIISENSQVTNSSTSAAYDLSPLQPQAQPLMHGGVSD